MKAIKIVYSHPDTHHSTAAYTATTFQTSERTIPTKMDQQEKAQMSHRMISALWHVEDGNGYVYLLGLQVFKYRAQGVLTDPLNFKERVIIFIISIWKFGDTLLK